MRWRLRFLAIAVVGAFLGQVSAPLHGTAATIPIDHVVVLMQENRSFDSYFGRLHYEGQPKAVAEPLNASNPNPLQPNGPPIRNFHKKRYCEKADLNHSWNGAHLEYDHGAMDGFTSQNVNPKDHTGRRTMGWYDKRDLPFYYALYKKFAINDHYYSSLLGPTFPNRFYELAGTSFGHIRNDFPTSPTEFAPPNGTIFERLDQAGVSWRYYYSEVPFAYLFAYVRNQASGHVFPISQYYTDAANGDLPQVSFIDPIFEGQANTENDEHPSSNIQVGEQFVSNVVSSLFASPNWPSSALFLTYDENGGFFDHVKPPSAPAPDNIRPMLQPGDFHAGFNRYGFRVPLVVVSPYSRAHFVSHVTEDHTAILKFLETRFGLPSLTNRDAQASSMLEYFDFSSPAFATPPTLPPAPLDPVQFEECTKAPPNDGI